MAFNGSGTFVLVSGNPVVTGTTISSTWANNTLSDVATGLSNCVTRDGQSPATANLPMGGFKLTGLATATALGDALSYGRAATVSTLTDSALTSGRVTYASTAGLLADSANLTFDGTTLTAAGLATGGSVTLSGGTANGVAYLNGSKVLTTGSALTFNGSNALTQTANSAEFYLAGGSSAAQGGFLSISRGGTTKIILGTASNVLGGGSNTSDDLTLFATADTRFYASGTEQMRLTNTGLGIGTSSPAYKLDVAGIARSDSWIGRSNTSAPATDAFIYRPADNTLGFGTGSTERMRIDSSGNVGIGTSSPSTKLHVSGSSNPILRVTDTRNTVNLDMQPSGTIAYFGTASNHPLAFQTNSTEVMRLDSSGNLLVGTTTKVSKVTCSVGGNADSCFGADFSAGGGTGIGFRSSYSNSTGTAYHAYFVYNGTGVGYISSTSTTTTYGTSSDQRLKENIVDAPSALASINAIKVRSFDWKSSGEHQEYGYIAQELLEVVPEAVSVPADENEMMGVDFGKLTPRLVKALQEQQAIIEQLTARITTLEAK